MERAGRHLLARAALAEDQHGRGGRRRARDNVGRAAQGRALADQPPAEDGLLEPPALGLGALQAQQGRQRRDDQSAGRGEPLEVLLAKLLAGLAGVEIDEPERRAAVEERHAGGGPDAGRAGRSLSRAGLVQDRRLLAQCFLNQRAARRERLCPTALAPMPEGERLRLTAVGEKEGGPLARHRGEDPLQGFAGQSRGIARCAAGRRQLQESRERPAGLALRGRLWTEIDRLARGQADLGPCVELDPLLLPSLLRRRASQEDEERRLADPQHVPVAKLLLVDWPAVDERALPAVEVGDAPPGRRPAQHAVVAGDGGVRDCQIVRRMAADGETVTGQVESPSLETAAQSYERRGHQMILDAVLYPTQL